MVENPREWFETRVARLDNHLECGILQEMKSFVLHSEKTVLNDVVHNVSLQPLFDYLASSNQDIDVVCTIIYELLSQLDPKELFSTFEETIHRSLNHNSNEVKDIRLKLMERSINDDTVAVVVAKQMPLLIDAAECLASEERSIAQRAISVFIKLGSNPTGATAFYSSTLLKKLKDVMVINDISRFRVYELIVALSKFSPENLEKGISSGLMEDLVSEVFSSDVLIQLNALEILGNLATSNHGINYLSEKKVIQYLISKLQKIQTEPLAPILLPGLIEFFGNMCAYQPEQFTNEYPQVMSLLFSGIEENDESLLGVTITSIGKVGSSCSGRNILKQHKDQMRRFFTKTQQFLNCKTDLAVTVVNSLSELLKKINGDASCNEITEEWFDYMGFNATEVIVNLGKLPFIEIRLPALALLKTLAAHSWGAKKLCNYPGMIEYLLNRSSEYNKDCKQTKFDIVCNIVQSAGNSNDFLNPDVLHTLKEFVKEGPFYVPLEVETAIEGAN
ncbi:hypothetical protein RUM43_007551 [Polyplax serrata]|uniref:26S proteasome non-ATPase regulatory subunit 5 n=1 Tax=Polyplax serrata TaxID=468196 RepID=A0AAN8P230_POLSC